MTRPVGDTLLIAVTDVVFWSPSYFYYLRAYPSVNPIMKTLPIGKTWTMDTLKQAADTIVYGVKLNPNWSYHVQMSNAQDPVASLALSSPAMTQLSVGSIGLQAGWDGGHGFMGSNPLLLDPHLNSSIRSDSVLLRVVGAAGSNVGSFGLRVYPATREKLLPVSKAWTSDSLGLGEDIQYKVPTHGYESLLSGVADSASSLCVEWEEQPATQVEQVVVSYRSNASAYYTASLTHLAAQRLCINTWYDTLVVKVGGVIPDFAGRVKVRVVTPRTWTIHADMGWLMDSITSGDTLTYRVLTLGGAPVRFQWSDSLQGPWALQPSAAKISVQAMAMGGVPLWSAPVPDGYFTSRVATPPGDTTEFKVTGTSGWFAVRAYPAYLLHREIVMQPSPDRADSVDAGDTLTFKIPVTTGQTYQIAKDDRFQGSGFYSGYVVLQLPQFNLPFGPGPNYLSPLTVTAPSDTLVVNVAPDVGPGGGGRFGLKVVH